MSEQPNTRTTADWLVELCIYAPIGFALDAHKYVPEFVNRGRNQVALARFLGKFALERVEKQLGPLAALRCRTPEQPGATTPAPDQTTSGTASPPPSAPAPAEPTSPRSAPTPTTAGSKTPSRPVETKAPAAKATRKAAPPKAAPRKATGRKAPRPQVTGDEAMSTDAEQLAVEGYATLSASQIVPRLTTLARADLETIQRYERANRNRRTILNRIDQLLNDR